MPSVGAVSYNPNLYVTSQTGTYTAKANDLVLANATAAAFTITLPTAPATNSQVIVKKIDTSANAVTVVGSGATTIDGTSTLVLTVAQAASTFVYDGSAWRVSGTASFGLGGSTARLTATYTTSGAVAGTNYSGTITMASGYRLLALQTSAAARVRLYTDAASQGTDASRTLTTVVPDNAGLVLEYLTSDSTLQKLAPAISGYSMESVPSTSIPIVVTPTAASAVTVTLTYAATE